MRRRTLILALTVLALAWGPLLAAPQKAVFIQVKGKVSVVHNGKETPAKAGLSLSGGDEVVCDSGSARVVLRTDVGNEIRLKGKTRVKFTELRRGETAQYSRLELLAGRVWAAVTKLKTAGSRFEIKAGGVVCGVRGTTLGGQYDPKKDKGRFKNHKGRIFVTGSKKGPREIPEGHYCDFAGGALGNEGGLSGGDKNEFGWKAPPGDGTDGDGTGPGGKKGGDGKGGRGSLGMGMGGGSGSQGNGGGQGDGDSGFNTDVVLPNTLGGVDETLGDIVDDTILNSDIGPGRLLMGFEFPERNGEPIGAVD